ncbi:MAG: TIM-barrel domain-containing protein [Acidobacteriota bacterium]
MSNKIDPYDAPRDFDLLKSVRDWHVEDETLVLRLLSESGKEGTIRFRAEQPSIWRITFLPPGYPSDSRKPTVAQPVLTPLPLAVEKTDRGLRASSPELTLEIEFRPWRMRFLAPDGSEVLAENPGDVDGLGRPFALPLGYTEKNGKPASVTASFKLAPGEHLFGLGEKFTRLDKAGQRITSWTQDALGSTTERSHKNIPFLWSNRGYGLYLDTAASITWDLGAASCQSATVRVEEAALDAYLIYGPAPAKILEHYAGLTGRSPVPPKWTFGLWLSAGGTYRNQQDVERLVHGLERHDLPADVIHIDTWWMRPRRYCDFEWDRAAFPDPQRLIDSLHARGLKLSLWEHPYVSVESELFVVGREKGYFVRRPDGEVYIIDYGLSLAPLPDGVIRQASGDESWNARVAIIDFANPEATAWYKDLHRPLLRAGVDAFKTDFGEDVPADAVFANGQTGATMHNLYPFLYNRAVFEVVQEEKGTGIVWARSAFAGSQQYPVVWSGDPAANFESLASTVRGGLSAGLSGLPFWSNDIGGYRGMPSAELYVRWAHFGLFCSHSRMHGDSPREPWFFGEEAIAIVRRYAELRYELFPYIYSAAYEASLRGIPVIRALPLVFPEDPNVFDKDFEYMFGPWILVAPVIEPGGKRQVYLPEGRWADCWSGKTHEGPKNLKIEAPLECLPLFIRAGAIIPKGKRAWRIPEERIDPLVIEVWPRGKSTYRLYEDEGVTEFNCDQRRKELSLEWSGPLPRRIIFHFKGIAQPQEITLKAEEVPDRIQELEGLWMEKTYVLAVPETRAARLSIRFSSSLKIT